MNVKPRSPAPYANPLPVTRVLRKLGRNIREAGDPGVSIGTAATVLFVLGMVDSLGEPAERREPIETS